MGNKGGDEFIKFLTKAIQSTSKMQQERTKLETEFMLQKLKSQTAFTSSVALDKAKKANLSPGQEQTQRINEAEISQYNQQQGGNTSAYGMGGPVQGEATPGGPGTYGPIPGQGQHMAPSDAPSSVRAPGITPTADEQARTSIYPEGGKMKRKVAPMAEFLLKQLEEREAQGIPLSAKEQKLKERAMQKVFGKDPSASKPFVTRGLTNSKYLKVVQIIREGVKANVPRAGMEEWIEGQGLEVEDFADELENLDNIGAEIPEVPEAGKQKKDFAGAMGSGIGMMQKAVTDPIRNVQAAVKTLRGKEVKNGEAITARIEELRTSGWSDADIYDALAKKGVKPEDYGLNKARK